MSIYICWPIIWPQSPSHSGLKGEGHPNPELLSAYPDIALEFLPFSHPEFNSDAYRAPDFYDRIFEKFLSSKKTPVALSAEVSSYYCFRVCLARILDQNMSRTSFRFQALSSTLCLP